MNQPPSVLAARARQLARLASAHPALAARADRLAERAAAQRFHVAVVGAFKRGKSTVVNALLDQSVLPVGVLPLTAIATEVAYGPAGATIVGLDETRTDIALADLARYVTEMGNPGNALGVARVEVRLESPLLASGLVLVDTPGLGSIHGHDTDTHRAVEQSDAAIVVLAADMALAGEELQLLTEFTRRHARVFVVVNKADHVDPCDLDAVRSYVAAACGDGVPIWCVSARAALDHHAGQLEFGAFRTALEQFVGDDLQAERDAAASIELRSIAHHLAEHCRLEAAAACLDADQLATIAAGFRHLANAERDTLTAEHLLVAERCLHLLHEMTPRLAARVRNAADHHRDDLTETTAGPLSGLEARLDAAVDRIVRGELADWQTIETESLDRSWQALATTAHRRATERVAAVRTAAAELFAIDLDPVAVGKVSDEPDTFWFLLAPPASMSDPYIHLGRLLQPAALRRRKALRRANRRLTEELDKHAGRLHHALAQRLDSSRQRFTDVTRIALDNAINDIEQAITVAEQRGAADADTAAAALERARHALDLGT